MLVFEQAVQVFAGVDVDTTGQVGPTAFGRLCEWQQNPTQPSDGFNSFGAYQRSLSLDCQQGQPGILQWTPDVNTPDTVYYQVCKMYIFCAYLADVFRNGNLSPKILKRQDIPKSIALFSVSLFFNSESLSRI